MEVHLSECLVLLTHGCVCIGVAHYSYFKSRCPRAYAYAYDDPTALFHCAVNKKADYTITFCP